ncbi:hypothetical protein ACR3K2_34660 [Cryptosporidium serpentis]
MYSDITINKEDQNESYPPMDHKDQFFFCKEHERRTCCNKSHPNILSRLYSTFILNTSLSQNCVTYYLKSWCSYCDADVGIGMKLYQKKPVLCHSLCEDWYNSCKTDYFGDSNNYLIHDNTLISARITPCSETSVLCSQLHTITTNPDEFCRLNGFISSRELSLTTLTAELHKYININKYLYGEHPCFDGTNAASIKGPGIQLTQASINKINKFQILLYMKYLINYTTDYLSRKVKISFSAFIFIIGLTIWLILRIINNKIYIYNFLRNLIV